MAHEIGTYTNYYEIFMRPWDKPISHFPAGSIQSVLPGGEKKNTSNYFWYDSSNKIINIYMRLLGIEQA